MVLSLLSAVFLQVAQVHVSQRRAFSIKYEKKDSIERRQSVDRLPTHLKNRSAPGVSVTFHRRCRSPGPAPRLLFRLEDERESPGPLPLNPSILRYEEVHCGTVLVNLGKSPIGKKTSVRGPTDPHVRRERSS